MLSSLFTSSNHMGCQRNSPPSQPSPETPSHGSTGEATICESSLWPAGPQSGSLSSGQVPHLPLYVLHKTDNHSSGNCWVPMVLPVLRTLLRIKGDCSHQWQSPTWHCPLSSSMFLLCTRATTNCRPPSVVSAAALCWVWTPTYLRDAGLSWVRSPFPQS